MGDPTVNPTQEDGFVRGVSEVVGGALGEHAGRGGGRERTGMAARVVMAVTLCVFCLHWIQKAPCQDGAWSDHEQYTRFCYTDIVALYYAEHLHEGAVPYFDWPVEYPVLTGFFMGVLGLPVHDIAQDVPGLNQVQAFYNLNALVLSAFGVAAVAVVLALRRRRPWDAMMFAAAPALVVTATVNWDLLAVGLTAFFLYAWARRWPVAAGVALGLAGAAKFYPLLLAGPLVVLAIRSRRWRAAATAVATAAATWIAVNAPVFVWANDGWDRFWSLSSTRQVDWGTLWYIGAHTPVSTRPAGGVEPFLWLGAHVEQLNLLTVALFGLGCLGIAALGLKAPSRPRLAQLCFLVIAVFLLTSKVWSQQFVLWLIPLVVLARPRWGAFLAWQAAEIGYFLAFYAQMLNVSGRFTIPEGTFVLAASLRWMTVAALVAFVVRDIRRPDGDVVRRAYQDLDADGWRPLAPLARDRDVDDHPGVGAAPARYRAGDPDGGDFDDAPDPGPIRAGTGFLTGIGFLTAIGFLMGKGRTRSRSR